MRVTLGPDVDADHVTCYATFDDTDPAGDRGRATSGIAIELDRAASRWDTLAWTYVEAWTGTIPGQPAGTMVRYRLQAWSDDGRVDRWVLDAADDAGRERAPGADGVARGAAFAVHVDDEAIPDWLRDAVIYQVFVDRFAGPDGARARDARLARGHLRRDARGRASPGSTTSPPWASRACG